MCQGIGCCLLSWSVTALPLILGLGPWSLDFGSCDVSSFAQTALGDPQMPVPVHFFSLNTLISMSFQLPYADTAYKQCIIHIYVFLCSFHVLQYAWNHLYHNHMPETLKLYFKKNTMPRWTEKNPSLKASEPHSCIKASLNSQKYVTSSSSPPSSSSSSSSSPWY